MAPTQAIRIPVRRNPHYKAHGHKSLVSAMHKFAALAGAQPSHGQFTFNHQQKKLVKKQADGTNTDITANDVQEDSLYTVAVNIGGQTMDLDFDTGSSDLWVMSTKMSQTLQSQAKSSGLHIFDPTKSSTFKTMANAAWKIQYGDGSTASGPVGTDNVEIGNITIKQQAVELAQTVSSQFVQGGSDGLLGLAFNKLNTVTVNNQAHPVNTPVTNMIAQNDIPANMELFTCYLGSWKDADEADKGESFYTFGAIDQSVVQASGKSLSYIPIDNSQGFWQFNVSHVTINGTSTNLTTKPSIADTGTTLLLMDDAICQAFYGKIPGATNSQSAGGWVFPSSTKASQIPKLAFPWGNTIITIAAEDFPFSDAGNNTVYGGMQSNAGMGLNILGDVFLKNVYAVWDVSKPQLGVVQRTVKTQNMTASSGTS